MNQGSALAAKPPPDSEEAAVRSEKGRIWSRFRRNRLAIVGLVLFISIALPVIFAPMITSHDPITINARKSKAPPSLEHPLGTDDIGRDVMSRVLYGGRVSLSVGVIAVSISLFIGVVLGAVSGYFGGVPDMAIQRLAEVVVTLPSLMIIITIVALIGPSIYNIFLTIGLLGWPGVCRLVRAEFLSLRERDFVQAARATGASTGRIIFRHILRNSMAPVIVAGTLGVAGAILTETGLSFLGLGIQPPTPSWGNLLTDATKISILETMWWRWVPTGVLVSLTVLSINFVGDGLRDALDPRSRA